MLGNSVKQGEGRVRVPGILCLHALAVHSLVSHVGSAGPGNDGAEDALGFLVPALFQELFTLGIARKAHLLRTVTPVAEGFEHVRRLGVLAFFQQGHGFLIGIAGHKGSLPVIIEPAAGKKQENKKKDNPAAATPSANVLQFPVHDDGTRNFVSVLVPSGCFFFSGTRVLSAHRESSWSDLLRINR